MPENECNCTRAAGPGLPYGGSGGGGPVPITFNDDISCFWGTDQDFSIHYDTVQTNPAGVFTVDDTNQAMHIARETDKAVNWGAPAYADPTWIWHNHDPLETTKWGAVHAGDDNFEIFTGVGIGIKLLPGTGMYTSVGTGSASLALNEDDLYITDRLQIDGRLYSYDAIYMMASSGDLLRFSNAIAGRFTYDPDDGLLLAVNMTDGQQNGNVIITDNANAALDHGHNPASTYPTLWHHGTDDPTSDLLDWARLYYNSSTDAYVMEPAKGVLELQYVNDGALGAQFQIYHDSASPAVDDAIGVVGYYGNNDAAEKYNYGAIVGQIKSVTDGSESGDILIMAAVAGSVPPVEFMRASGENDQIEVSKHTYFALSGEFDAELTTSGRISQINTISAATHNTVNTDEILNVTRTAVGACGITLLDVWKETGRIFTIKDAAGNAGTFNITITPQTGTIDTAANYVINANYASIRLYSDGTNWFIF